METLQNKSKKVKKNLTEKSIAFQEVSKSYQKGKQLLTFFARVTRA
jgi:hypothetical protein